MLALAADKDKRAADASEAKLAIAELSAATSEVRLAISIDSDAPSDGGVVGAAVSTDSVTVAEGVGVGVGLGVDELAAGGGAFTLGGVFGVFAFGAGAFGGVLPLGKLFGGGKGA